MNVNCLNNKNGMLNIDSANEFLRFEFDRKRLHSEKLGKLNHLNTDPIKNSNEKLGILGEKTMNHSIFYNCNITSIIVQILPIISEILIKN